MSEQIVFPITNDIPEFITISFAEPPNRFTEHEMIQLNEIQSLLDDGK